jgi:hypothetical protein
MKKILILFAAALFLLGGVVPGFAGTPNLLDTTWQGEGTIVGPGGSTTTFGISFTINFQDGAVFAGTGTLLPGQITSFTGFIAKDKRITITVKSLIDDTAVALSSAKLHGKKIDGDLQVLPISATGFFSVTKQQAD